MKMNPEAENMLWQAICDLACHRNNLEARLASVYEKYLSKLQREDMPNDSLRDTLVTLQARLTLADEPKGLAAKAVERLQPEESIAIAGKICDMYHEATHLE